ncbi:hypothetical protein FB382_003369 [Nocardioides ginsengisegetis]|uniref:DUF4190 domain-containing protein n=1 Tax=Nocardioides ginsengisegetis TaxID=661491 RepID=A0A7W3PAY1_9ACTN|nr:hypothetical protein [Nocardioides ginsengisegetis]MBA8805078.1 hypothetical protein [Nocardioides ginsengisegetis]
MSTSDSENTGDAGQGESLPPTHTPYGQLPPAAPQDPQAQPPYGAPQPPYGQVPPQYPAPQTNPYGQPPAAPYTQPYAQQNPYGQPQPGYPAPQAPYGYAQPALPNHPSSTTAFVLSLVALAGIVFCGGITLVLSPFAWRIGARAVREIDASPGQYGGRDQANAGRIMGIIGTVLLVIGLLFVVGVIALLAVSSTTSSTTTYR